MLSEESRSSYILLFEDLGVIILYSARLNLCFMDYVMQY
jgi:hypothetical protein